MRQEPAARLLPRAAQAGPARARGRRARLRHGRGADPPQRQPPGSAAARALHEQLPGRGPAHHRRAVGLAEHAEARPSSRTCGASRRRRSRRARPAARPTPTWPGSTRPGTAGRRRSAGAPPYRLRRPAPAAPARVRPPPRGGARRRRRPSRWPSRCPPRTRSGASISARPRRQVSVANVITSLRLLATLDWSQYFESVSLVERVLQRDPAGAYGSMDFLSRDRYRQAVEELAEGTGEGQMRVALRAVESARQAAESGTPADLAAHVGHHLIGKGRRRPRDRPRLSSRASANERGASSSPTPPPSTSGLIGLLTALGLSLGVSYLARARGLTLAVARRWPFSCCCPASERRDRVRPTPGRALGAAPAASPPRVLRRRPRGRADHGGHSHPADRACPGSRLCSSTSRCWPSATSIRGSISRS